MAQDATFEEGQDAPLNLGALDLEDLKIISALVQDSVFPITEMKWNAKQRRFGLLLNRFRWEEGARSQAAPERVQSLLAFDGVLGVASQGIDRGNADMILSLMAIEFEAGAEGSGDILLTLAGDGAIRLRIETIEATLKDVTRPYVAPSKRAPSHPE